MSDQMTETKKRSAELPKVADETIEAHILDSEMPTSIHGIYRRAMKGRARTAAVKAFCLECQGFDRRGVTECPSTACALWRYRPFQVAA